MQNQTKTLWDTVKTNIVGIITSALMLCLIAIYGHFWNEQAKLNARVCKLEENQLVLKIDVSLIKEITNERTKTNEANNRLILVRLDKLEDLMIEVLKYKK